MGHGDFLVHHAIALGLRRTALILVKSALDASGSKLIPDKKDSFCFLFDCFTLSVAFHFCLLTHATKVTPLPVRPVL